MKRNHIPSIIITIAVFFFINSIIVSQLFTPESYYWIQNTVSELAAQGYDNAWIMKIGLIGYGLLLGAGLILRLMSTREFIFPDLLLLIYSIGILLSGIYSTAPFEKGLDFLKQESYFHSFFASAAGVSISISMISYFFAEENFRRKLFHFIFMLLVVGFSALFGLAESGAIPIGKGLVQRSMYLFGLTWILVNYNYFRSQKINY